MSIKELYEIFKAHPSVQTDTRKLQVGDLFFALKGPSFNGNEFATQALNEGAAFAIVDDASLAGRKGMIAVPDVLEMLQQLALHHRRQFSIPFIAITGSNGKTTTKELITAVLRKKFVTYATSGNLNNHIGVPLTLLSIKPDAEMAVIEMGANHRGEIESYCRITEPTHGIITNCGKAHIEGFGSEEGVRLGKGELYDYLRTNRGIIFRNTDLPYLEEMAIGIPTQITYGSENADYTASPKSNGTLLATTINFRDRTLELRTNLVGDYNLPNILVAAAVGDYFGVSMNDVQSAIESYNPDNSRSQWIERGSNHIILDAYNANPTSMKAAVENFNNITADKKLLWLGGMKEMGGAEKAEHEELISLVEKYAWKKVILVGEEFRGLEKEYLWFSSSMEAAEYLENHPPENATILIKGSRGSRMELLLEALPA